MVAHLLRSGGIDATAFLGGISLNLGNNFVEGQSDWVVAEADEYDRSFHHLYPEIAILNSIDPDHLDIYGTPEAVVEDYGTIRRQIKPGSALICRHGLPLDALTDELRASGRNVYTFGIEEGDFQAKNLRVEEGRMVFEFGADSKSLDKINAATSGNPSPSLTPPQPLPLGEGSGHEIRSAPLPGGGGVGGGVERGVGVNKADELRSDITAATTLTLRYPGRHNILNATAASAAALLAGVSLSDLPAALDSFAGVHRRFEYIVRRPEWCMWTITPTIRPSWKPRSPRRACCFRGNGLRACFSRTCSPVPATLPTASPGRSTVSTNVCCCRFIPLVNKPGISFGNYSG